jgi:flagellar hook-associated protein 3 FlgL
MRMSTSMLNDSAVGGILQDQSALSKTQNELSSGQSVNTPADDPVAAVELLQLNNTSSQYQQYISNGQSANTRLTLEEQALSDSTTTLQSIRDLVVQANSGTNNSSDLQSLGSQIQSLEQQLQGIANRQDAQGQYLFSGYSEGTQPFVRGRSGAVSYVGDSGARSVQLDSGTSVQMGDAGSAVYVSIPSGNGTFTTAASSGNTGTGLIDTGSVTNKSAWVPGQYTITFTDPTDYQVTNSSGSVVSTGTYDSSNGGSVAFNGIEVGITGAPATGDTFTVSPSGTESVFTTLDKLVNSLNNAGSSPAARAQLGSSLAGSLQQIDQALNQVSSVTSSVGSRISLISSVNSSLTSQSTTVTSEISNLSSVDYVAATAQYSQEYLALQAAEQSYAQIGQLSLFKYL